ncbi:unnamed protein product [Tetraodon nigroviridis]|uniref:(spotted green pufferfish) hypothetical protein n=1 Tax=Tetraodon nigroviridis TaxID=99883 RepID=Q4TG89_TETNG|nr:unnamed protein product [Tetraodon nigroviridis]
MSERRADREEDYRFLHSMLMEKKLHLLFKVKTLSSTSALSHHCSSVQGPVTPAPLLARGGGVYW